MVSLFFGGYDIPFVNDATLIDKIGVNWMAVLQGRYFLLKSFVSFFYSCG